MSADQFSYSQAKGRLDDIVVEVRKKDISLEKSLDLLEEGVRLANRCTELIDQADWEALVDSESDAADETDEASSLEGDAHVRDLDSGKEREDLQERHNG